MLDTLNFLVQDVGKWLPNRNMLKLLGINREAEPQLPNDQLEPTRQLKRGKSVLEAQAGIPSTADGLAYDPVQRLLAVSTSHLFMSCLCLGVNLAKHKQLPAVAAGQHQRWQSQSTGARRGGGAAFQCTDRPSAYQTAPVCPQQRWTDQARPGWLAMLESSRWTAPWQCSRLLRC